MHARDTTQAERIDFDPFVEVYGVGASDDLVGIYSLAKTQAFMLGPGAPNPAPLPIQIGAYSRAQGINSFGIVVGRATNGGPNPQSQPGFAFIWDCTQVAPPTLFSYPIVAKSTYANGINDAGCIVGEFRGAEDPSSPSRGFVRYPTLPRLVGMPLFHWPRWRTSPTQASPSSGRASSDIRKGAHRTAPDFT